MVSLGFVFVFGTGATMRVLTPLDRQKQCTVIGHAAMLLLLQQQLGRSKSNMAAARDAGWMASSCNMTSYREMSVKGQGYQLRLETAPTSSGRFLIVGVEPRKARGSRKGVNAWGRGSHRVRFTPALLPCSLLDLFFYGTYKERSPRCSTFLLEREALTPICVVQR